MRIGIALTTVMLAALLSGCQSDEPAPDGEASPATSSSSPSSSESADASPSNSPKKESPKAFLRRVQRVSDKMQNTGETSEYLSLTRNCSACEGFAEAVEKIYDAGGRVEYAGSEILSIKRVEERKPEVIYDVRVRIPETKVWDTPDAKVKVMGGTVPIYRKTLERRGSSWVLVYYSELAQ